MIWVWILLVVVVGVPTVVGLLQLGSIALAKVRRVDRPQVEPLVGQATREVGAEFLERSGFLFVGVYDVITAMGVPRVVMWQHGNEATYLALLLVGNTVNTDIVSILSWDRGIGVTTATTRDGHTVPRPPRSWLQSFGKRTTAALWEKHQEAEMAVADFYGVEPEPVLLEPREVLERSLRIDARYVLSRPWLLMMVTWRFWAGRFLLHNKPVAARLPKSRPAAV